MAALVVVVAAMLGASGVAQAAVTFDRAFGIGVDTGAAAVENCTTASGCQVGTASGDAGGVNRAHGVAVDGQGGILVANRNNNRVDRFVVAPDGTVSFDRAFGIGVDTGAAAFENCTTASGCQPGTASGAAGGMNRPSGVAVDAQGRIVVADQSNHRIDRFAVADDGTVAFQRAFAIDVDPSDGNTGDFENCTAVSTCKAGTPSGDAGGMHTPFEVSVDAQGRILVGDFLNNRVDRFAVAGDGTVSFDRAFGIGVDTGGAGFENCTTASGCESGLASGDAGGMNQPVGVDVDAQGRILVGDFFNHRVDRFAVAGDGTVSFDRAFGIGVDTGGAGFENCTTASGCQAGTNSGAAGGVSFPNGVAVDAQGRILVVETGNPRLSRFAVADAGTVSFDRAFGIGVDTGAAAFENCTTATTCQAGTDSGDAGGMAGPSGVAVDARGRILVADRVNNRVDRFSPGPTITVTKALVPATDPGTFDLRVDSVVVRTGAVNGQSGSLQVADGVDVTISEQAADAQHPLSAYDTTIDCGSGPQPGTSLTVTNVSADVNCTITNTRKQADQPAGGGQPPGGTTAPPADQPPLLGQVRLTNPRFMVDPEGEAETLVTARKLGTKFVFTLSEPARVVFTIKRRGRRSYGLVGRFAVSALAGKNHKRFAGRLGNEALEPGLYRVKLVATDLAGNRSKAKRRYFRVLKP